MNNGAASLKKILDDRWEVVEAFGSRWIGCVIEEPEEAIILSPAFVYVSNPQMQPNPEGPKGSVGLGWQRIIIPLEMLASTAKITVRWSARYRIADFDSADQAMFESAVAEAMANQRKISAARSGIALVSEMPKLPPVRG